MSRCAPALVLLALLARPALAGPPRELAVSATGQCPAAERVQKQLMPLLPDTRVFLGPRESAETVWVADAGEEFRVKVRDVERVIANPVRDCEERARIAAVLVALVVDPPLPAADSGTPEVHPPPPPPPPGPPPARSEAWEWTATVGATVALAPGSEGSRTWGAGPLVRGQLGRDGWEVALTAAFVSPVRLDLESGGVRMTRAPLDLSGGLSWGGSVVRGVVGAGVAGDLLHLEGTGVAEAQSSLRFDVGLRAHVGVRFRFGAKVWGVTEVSGTYFPRPYEFEVPPHGVVGHTPAYWLGATIGVLFEIR